MNTIGIHSAAMGEDLVHLVRTVPGEKLRGAVDAALREERAGISHQLAVDVVGGEEQPLQVDCYPYRPTPESEPPQSPPPPPASPPQPPPWPPAGSSRKTGKKIGEPGG